MGLFKLTRMYLLRRVHQRPSKIGTIWPPTCGRLYSTPVDSSKYVFENFRMYQIRREGLLITMLLFLILYAVANLVIHLFVYDNLPRFQ